METELAPVSLTFLHGFRGTIQEPDPLLEANTRSGSPNSLLLCQVIQTKDLIHSVSLSLTGHDIYFNVLNGTDVSYLSLHHTNSSLFPSFLGTLHERASISWRFSLTVTTTTTMNLAHSVCESCVLLKSTLNTSERFFLIIAHKRFCTLTATYFSFKEMHHESNNISHVNVK